MGISLGDKDVAIRCNLVTLSDEENYEDKTMIDYSSGEITTAESRELIRTIAEKFNDDSFAFYPVSATGTVLFGKTVFTEPYSAS